MNHRFTCGERKISSTIKKSENITNIIIDVVHCSIFKNLTFWRYINSLRKTNEVIHT